MKWIYILKKRENKSMISVGMRNHKNRMHLVSFIVMYIQSDYLGGDVKYKNDTVNIFNI